MSTEEFAGLVAVVTGAGSGIGHAIAALLPARGARVAGVDPDPSGVPGPASALPADVRSDAPIRAAIEQVAGHFGGIDILVNNAGIAAQGTVEDTDDEWHWVFDVNIFGIVRTTRAAVSHLRRSRYAAIVNTCSIAGTVGLRRRALYSASKGAVQSLTLAMAADHVSDGIRVNCDNPGTVDTPWVRGLLDTATDPATELAALQAPQLSGRLVSASKVAAAVVYPASPTAGSVTGTALAVDGGMQGLCPRTPGPRTRGF